MEVFCYVKMRACNVPVFAFHIDSKLELQTSQIRDQI